MKRPCLLYTSAAAAKASENAAAASKNAAASSASEAKTSETNAASSNTAAANSAAAAATSEANAASSKSCLLYTSWTTFNNKELPVTPADLYPADGGRVLKHQVNRFGWSVTAEGAEDAPGEIVQTSAVLRYRTQGQQDVKSVTISGAQTWHLFLRNS